MSKMTCLVLKHKLQTPSRAEIMNQILDKSLRKGKWTFSADVKEGK